MDKRQVEFTEAVKLKEGDFAEGDRHTFDKARADRYIAAGWAVCVATGETGERVPGSQPIEPEPVVSEAG